MDKERFEKQLAFILEVDKEKNILRSPFIYLVVMHWEVEAKSAY